MKPYYQDDFVTIYHGDAQMVLLDLDDVACVVTSPPYNTLGTRISKNAGGLHNGNKWLAKVVDEGYADDMDEHAYGAWLAGIADSLYGACRSGGSFFFNHKIRYRDRVPIHPLDLVRSFGDWRLRQEIVWDRRRAMALNARMFAPSDERIYWMVKPGADFTWNQDQLAMSVWPIVPDNDPGGKHPCPYPVAIPTRCIAATTNPGDAVLDPFMGSGTTLRAAKDLGRKAIGIEIEERYCEIAAQRMGQEVLDLESAA